MEKLKQTIKKLIPLFLTGLVLLLFNSCDSTIGEEILLPDSPNSEELNSWIDLLSQVDLKSEVAFVQNGESLQGAVDAALSGDVIYIEPGTYQGDLTINKSNIKLIGLSISPNDLVINNSKANNIDILKVYDQKSIADFQKKSSNKGTDDFIFDISRTELGDNIAHYQLKVRVGAGEYDVIRIHRVVRESRPYWPIETKGHVFMVHGALADFTNTFLAAGLESNNDINANTSAPYYLASNDIDVWGIDLGWTMVPAGTTDFSFFDGWGFEKDIDHALIGMLIARLGRGFSGQGFSTINALGFSSGTTVVYGAANRETQQSNMMKRHIRGLIPIDNAFKNEDVDASCWDFNNYDHTPLENSFGAFFNWMGYLAIFEAGGDSPIIPGLNNAQTLRVLFSKDPSPPPDGSGGIFHFFGGDYNGFFYSDESRIFRVATSYSPYMPNQIWTEFYALNCSSSDGVTFDDYLNLISVPIYYVGTGGNASKTGYYTSSLTASNDITNHVISVNADPSKDFGHVDTWLAYDADVLIWAELSRWIVNHS